MVGEMPRWQWVRPCHQEVLANSEVSTPGLPGTLQCYLSLGTACVTDTQSPCKAS